MSKVLKNKILILAALSMLIACGKKESGEAADTRKLPPVVVNASIDKVEATTGDIISYTVEVSSEPGLKVYIPEAGEKIAGFRIVDWGDEDPRELNDRIIVKKWYKLQADIIGGYIIPAVNVSYVDRDSGNEKFVSTAELFVRVKSSISDDEEFNDIIDIKPLVDLTTDYSRAVVIASAAGGVLIALLLLIYILRRRNRQVEIPALPPHETAFSELDKLKNSGLLQNGDIKGYYFAMSEIVRRYMEGRFGFPASEWTTQEILPVVTNGLNLDTVLKELIRTFLNNTDTVKFTDTVPDENMIQLELSRAYKFVEQTMEKDEDTTPNDSQANGQIKEEAA